MSDMSYQCGDHDALVSYLYDECDAATRQRIGAHLETCAACAGEVDALGRTRLQLAAWSPPEVRLDVRIGEEAQADRLWGAGAAPPVRTRPSARRWWTQPLPAWAQVAAALLIFAAGFSMGAVREPAAPAVAAVAPASEANLVSASPVSAVSPAPQVSPEDLVALEERLREHFGVELAGLSERMDHVSRAAAPRAAGVASEDFEELQRRVNILARQTQAVDAQQRADRLAFEQAFGQVRVATGEAVRKGEAIEQLVSYWAAQPRR